MSKRKKEQLKFLSKISMFDLEMINGIVYDKLQEQKKLIFTVLSEIFEVKGIPQKTINITIRDCQKVLKQLEKEK